MKSALYTILDLTNSISGIIAYVTAAADFATFITSIITGAAGGKLIHQDEDETEDFPGHNW